ncbi:hypothetical protein [Nostoc sp. 'Lobaria pulmonaria (5183) cyanobiont']|uniref:hypothetical protein n=1 Tax=Nostoc sp. 'Lobaria pulmonaria (5183) cyanobiont' TaxID=1618022 RepID=UPI000CF3120E|nr:hypothetical protein [Nostoc sp. 'Lobaria pulmonaria (5183) cyanobiont']
MNQDLLDIINLLQGFIPKLTGIENLNLKLAENINPSINFNFVIIGKQNKPLAIISPKNSTKTNLENPLDNVNESIAFLPTNTLEKRKAEPGNNIKFNIQNVPFSSGLHLIINQINWWNKKGNPEDKSVLIDNIKLIPIHENEWALIKTIENAEQFGLCLNRNGVIELEFPRNSSKRVIDINNLSSELSETFQFTEYKAGEIIKLEEIPDLLFSLEKNIVKKTILIEYKPKTSRKEYFLFILAQE